MAQTAVGAPSLREGQIVRGVIAEKILSRAAGGDIAFGKLVKWGTDPNRLVIELPVLPAADVDAIATAAVIASAIAAQSIPASLFDGIVGHDRIAPCRTVSVTFDASADWDTPSGECRVDIYGYDASGAEIHDQVARPNLGAVVYTASTRMAFAGVTRIDIEACNGAGGTATVGVSNDLVELSPLDYPGVALFQLMKEPNTAIYEIAQYDSVDVLQEGVVAVKVEHAVSVGDGAWVRILAAGADLRGQFTGQDGADTPTTYARLAGARFMSSAAIDGMAELEIGG